MLPGFRSTLPGRYLYAANEVTDFEGKSGAVSAYAVDRNNGEAAVAERRQF